MSILNWIIIIASLLCFTTSKLVQVLQIFRHGARYPLNSAFDGGDQEIDWGELIPSGMRQHYNLGRQLRKEYIEDLKLLSPTFNHTEFYIRSTDVNRTIMSAQSQLMGMFPNGPQIPKNIDTQYLLPPYLDAQNYLENDEALPNFFQPIPIHIEPSDYQVLSADCDGTIDLKKQDKDQLANIIQDFDVSTKQIRDKICSYFNEVNICDIEKVNKLYSVYISDSYQGKPVPQFSKEELDQFLLISSFKFYYDDAGSQYSKYVSQPFFNDIFEYLSQKIADPQSALKWVSYSAHDTNLVTYARALNLSSAECLYQTQKSNNSISCLMQPHYASNLIFELHQVEAPKQNDDQFYIKVKYDGVYQTICGNTQECSYSLFKQVVEGSLATQQEFDQVCTQKKTLQTTYLVKIQEVVQSLLTFSNVIIIVQLLIILTLAYYLVTKKKYEIAKTYLLERDDQISV